jgi:hypothetical protein
LPFGSIRPIPRIASPWLLVQTARQTQSDNALTLRTPFTVEAVSL